MKNLQDKLEDFKRLGTYAVTLLFGHDVGIDDIDVSLYERKVFVKGVPVGCVGETRLLFVGTLRDFLNCSFSKPKVISNPPIESEYKKTGWYIWGTPAGIKTILERNYKKRQ